TEVAGRGGCADGCDVPKWGCQRVVNMGEARGGDRVAARNTAPRRDRRDDDRLRAASWQDAEDLVVEAIDPSVPRAGSQQGGVVHRHHRWAAWPERGKARRRVGDVDAFPSDPPRSFDQEPG